MKKIMRVVKVLPIRDYKVYVYFEDGQIRLYDMSNTVGHGVFKAIEPMNTFIYRCTVINGTLAWDLRGDLNPYECLDIDPITIYEDGLKVKDPLAP